MREGGDEGVDKGHIVGQGMNFSRLWGPFGLGLWSCIVFSPLRRPLGLELWSYTAFSPLREPLGLGSRSCTEFSHHGTMGTHLLASLCRGCFFFLGGGGGGGGLRWFCSNKLCTHQCRPHQRVRSTARSCGRRRAPSAQFVVTTASRWLLLRASMSCSTTSACPSLPPSTII